MAIDRDEEEAVVLRTILSRHDKVWADARAGKLTYDTARKTLDLIEAELQAWRPRTPPPALMAKVKVHVFLKPGVLDVQGKAVEGALHGLGWADVSNARVGKMIEFDMAEADEAEVKRMCDTLLANTVIEGYRIEIV